MFENPRKGRQARNFTTNAPKILDLKSSSEQIFSRKLPLGAPVWIEVADYNKCFGLIFIWIVFVRRCMRSESSKYNGRSSSGDKGRPICWEWRRQDLTGKNGLFVGDHINVNQNIGTRHRQRAPWTSDLSAFWNEKILFVYWKFSGMYPRLRTFRHKLNSSRSAKRIAGGGKCSGQGFRRDNATL